MSDDYPKRLGSRNPNWNYGGKNWRLSRSKIDLFTECPKCFFIDNRLGISRPRGPAFTLNVAVDALLKKEFDLHRKQKTPHPLMEAYGIEAVPFESEHLESWRDNFQGIEYKDPRTGIVICGAIDDVWQDKEGGLIVVDYKATAKDGKMEALSDTKWENQYKRQLEIYQWLLRKNDFEVSDTGYFVYVNGRKDVDTFDGKLEFDITLIPHTGQADWVDGVVARIKETLDAEELPAKAKDCEFCSYFELRKEVEER